MLRVGVVGVGRVGSRFDEERGRHVPWSHVGAYLAHRDKIEIVGAAEIDAANRDAFVQRCPGVPVFAGAADMARAARPDIVSICTPTSRHLADVEAALAAAPVRAIWCEKPLASSLDEAERLLDAARARGAAVVVSYVRRWLPLWRRVKQIVDSGELGRTVSVRVAMPNRLLTIQSHAVDLALYLGSAAQSFSALQVPALAEDGEAAAVIGIQFASGAYGIVQPTGMRSQLLIEAEVIGSNGRVRAAEHDGKIVLEAFKPSFRFEGYGELAATRDETAESFGAFSPFAAIARELAAAAPDRLQRLDNGEDALGVQRILDGAQHRPAAGEALAR